MTLVASWVQRNSTLRQLVVASDSRIGGGEQWDACPKLVKLPRPATVMAMSGDATAAYSFLLQAINTCSLLDGHESGRTDIKFFSTTLRNIYADTRRHVGDLRPGQGEPDVLDLDVVLFGWSWRRQRFEGYSFRYNKRGVLIRRELDELHDEKAYGVYFAGDTEAVREARRRLRLLKTARGLPTVRRGDPNSKQIAREAFLQWEPLQVIQDVIADASHATRNVGGSPQVVQVYQYGDAESFVWQSENEQLFFGGRPILSRERYDRRVMRMVEGDVQVSFSRRSLAASSGYEFPDEPFK